MTDDPTRQAVDALADAKKRLKEQCAQWPTIRAIRDALDRYGEQNHLAELITQAFQGRQT